MGVCQYLANQSVKSCHLMFSEVLFPLMQKLVKCDQCSFSNLTLIVCSASIQSKRQNWFNSRFVLVLAIDDPGWPGDHYILPGTDQPNSSASNLKTLDSFPDPTDFLSHVNQSLFPAMFLSVLKFHFIATPAPILTPLCFEISTCLLRSRGSWACFYCWVRLAWHLRSQPCVAALFYFPHC